MFSPLNSLVCRHCITPYSDLIRLALYFKQISLSALSGSSRARRSVMTPPAVLKRRSEGTKRTEHYSAEISGTWYHFGRNRNRISGTSLILCGGNITPSSDQTMRHLFHFPGSHRHSQQLSLHHFHHMLFIIIII